MSTHTHAPLLNVEQVGDVALVTLVPRKILEEDTTEAIGQQLFGLLADFSCRKMLLNFSRVERLTSVLLGKLVMLHRKVEALGGRLALCNIQPSVYEIFRLLRLHTLLHIYDEEQPALQAFQG